MTLARCPACGEPLDIRRRPANALPHEEIAALLRFGATPSEVAELYHVSRQRIYDVAKANGLPTTRRRTP